MHTHITHTIRQLWHAHRTPIIAAVCGFLTCFLTSSTGPLDAYLRTDIEEQRAQALSSSSKRYHRVPRRTPRRVPQKRPSSALLKRALFGAGSASSSASSRTPKRTALATDEPSVAASTSASSAAPVLHAGPSDPIASSSSIASVPSFPPFDHTVYPVSTVPNWGAMTTPAEWERPYGDMTSADFVSLPGYDLAKLTVPLTDLLDPRNIPEITRKLAYSTRFFSAYDIDQGEFTGNHPGVDLKLALGTPLRSVAGGRVQTVAQNASLGLYVVIEHRHPTDGTFFSVYGHLASAAVRAGEDVTPGQYIGNVGMTGNTTGPHVHWQIDRAQGDGIHVPYAPATMPSAATAENWTMNPMRFVQRYAGG